MRVRQSPLLLGREGSFRDRARLSVRWPKHFARHSACLPEFSRYDSKFAAGRSTSSSPLPVCRLDDASQPKPSSPLLLGREGSFRDHSRLPVRWPKHFAPHLAGLPEFSPYYSKFAAGRSTPSPPLLVCREESFGYDATLQICHGLHQTCSCKPLIT